MYLSSAIPSSIIYQLYKRSHFYLILLCRIPYLLIVIAIGTSQTLEHLEYFPDHQFEWKLLTKAPEYKRKRKTLEAFLLKSINPFLNEQLNTELLVLFRNGVT